MTESLPPFTGFLVVFLLLVSLSFTIIWIWKDITLFMYLAVVEYIVSGCLIYLIHQESVREAQK